MKYVLWVVGGLLAIALLIGIAQYAASERVEVVELQTMNDQGEAVVTRLWVVDYEGHPYLRGESGSGWYSRLIASDEVLLTRNDSQGSYSYQIKNENIGNINALMREKYTWGDELIELMLGSRAHSNAVELTPN